MLYFKDSIKLRRFAFQICFLPVKIDETFPRFYTESIIFGTYNSESVQPPRTGQDLSEDYRYGFVLISDMKWWEKICERSRSGNSVHAFVRRNLVGPLYAEKLLFYVKRPFMQIRGLADFIERVTGDAEKLWDKYGGDTCLDSFESYLKLLGSSEKATFIRFTNLRELETPISLETLKKVLSISRIPRGGWYLSREALNQLIAQKGSV